MWRAGEKFLGQKGSVCVGGWTLKSSSHQTCAVHGYSLRDRRDALIKVFPIFPQSIFFFINIENHPVRESQNLGTKS